MSTSSSLNSPRVRRLQEAFLQAAHVDVTDILQVCKALKSQLNNASRIISRSFETQKQEQSGVNLGEVEVSEILETAEESPEIEAQTPEINGHSINDLGFHFFDDTPTKVKPAKKDEATGLSSDGQYDMHSPSIDHPQESRRTFSPSIQKRRQLSTSQIPCPGDGTDDLTRLENQSRTFPSVRKFASKMVRILPANRRERGGTLRYQTPEGGFKPLSPFPSTLGTSPSPYRMHLTPSTPGSYPRTRNSSELELFNTIQEYVVEVENERSQERKKIESLRKTSDHIKQRSDEITNELVKTAQELLNEGEKVLKLERECFQQEQKTFRKSISIYQGNERIMRARIEELEVENERLRAALVVEKGSDHLGVQGANPVTGVWSDVEGGREKEKEKGVGRKGGRGGRWRRTDTSWTFGVSESSTGTVVRNSVGGAGGDVGLEEKGGVDGRVNKEREKEKENAWTVIKNYHVHHHHHWRVVPRPMKRSVTE